MTSKAEVIWAIVAGAGVFVGLLFLLVAIVLAGTSSCEAGDTNLCQQSDQLAPHIVGIMVFSLILTIVGAKKHTSVRSKRLHKINRETIQKG